MKKFKLFISLISGIVISTLLILANTQCSAEGNSSKPNILIIYADDWGWGDLGCHGLKELKTPNIDRLASEGIDFHQFTVANPVCSPSRTAIMTGNFPARHSIHSAISNHEKNARSGILDWLDPNVTMLSRLLKEAGYTTGHFGKWHLSLHGPHVTPETPLPYAYGFDEAAVWTGPGRTVWENSSYADKEGKAGDPIAASYLTAAAVEHAIRFISEVRDRPFPILLSHSAPIILQSHAQTNLLVMCWIPLINWAWRRTHW
jgi:N-acetylgalactosamine-6-sulfatase